jgi:dTDP-glucose 4,6-dehydratase
MTINEKWPARILVTGGAGFIGSNLIRYLLDSTEATIVNVDRLTFAGSVHTLDQFRENARHRHVRLDIADSDQIGRLLGEFQPDAVVHLAAESHVDRSIDEPEAFIHSNIVGTYSMLIATRRYWRELAPGIRDSFRFLHVSTDEVHGSLNPDDPAFAEGDPYRPSSPYAASKASSDHLVRAWHHTYGFPALITNCSNNYGPYQFPEKLIPLMIAKAMAGERLPVYGRGLNVRDWLYVEDHVRALATVLKSGRIGDSYNIGGNCERQNIEVVRDICALLDEIRTDSPQVPHARLIDHVTDRPGHDLRYAMNTNKITTELGWRPQESFATGLRKTVNWFLDNSEWCRNVMAGTYRGERLGLEQR